MPVWKKLRPHLAAALAAATLLAACGGQGASTSKGTTPATTGGKSSTGGQVQLLETGSSLLYPLFNIWVSAYQKDHPGVRITTQSTGSGTGIAEALRATAQIGASDAYMPTPQVKQHPEIENIPLAISAQQINYNVPGLNKDHIRLSGPVLAKIYSGTITKWNDPAIARMNPGLKLPGKAIVPVHRTDGSGDSFLFTQYLSFSDPNGWGKAVGFSTAPNFPAVTGGLGANGNPGMVQALQHTPYAIAYVGISYLDQTNKDGLGYAALRNKAGNYVLPTSAAISEAASSVASKTPADERISIIFPPGTHAYPIVNYEYSIVSTKQHSAAQAAAIKKFLTWAISSSGGNAASFLNQVHFIPLPAAIAKLSLAQVAKIGG